MASTNSAETLMGPMPSPHTCDFLKWVDNVLDYRRRYCTFKRTTNTYFIDPVGGNDANNGTTTATPWKSLTPVRTSLSGNPTNTAYLFKRGTVLYDYTGLNITSSGIYLGSYGAFSSAGKPIISYFTVNLSGVTWTNASGNRWTATIPGSGVNNPSGATSIGWIRLKDDTLSPNGKYLPFTFVDSTTKCENTTLSFYQSGTTISINLGGADPNGVPIEATPGGVSPSGIFMGIGSDKFWADDLIVEGFGCLSLTSTNNSGFLSGCGPEETNYVSNCESYYNGRHALSQESSDVSGSGQGGIYFAENCEAGYCSPKGGAVLFNSFSSAGKHETYFVRCVAKFGLLPADASGVTAPVAGGLDPVQVFYGHTGQAANGTTKFGVGLYLNISCRILDYRDETQQLATVSSESFPFPDVASKSLTNDFVVGTVGDPSTYRCFVIDWESPRIRTTAQPTGATRWPLWEGISRMAFINSRFYFRHAFGSDVTLFANKTSSLFLNCIFEIESENSSNIVKLFGQGSAVNPDNRLLNCLISCKGASSGSLWVTTDQSLNLKLANTLIIGWDRVNTSSGMKIILNQGFDEAYLVPNSSSNLRYIAIAGAQNTDGTPYPFVHGFSNATGFINLETNNNTYPLIGHGGEPISGNRQGAFSSVRSVLGLSPSSALAGAGSANPFGDQTTYGTCPAPQYDFYGRPRPSTPAIGPFDVLTQGSGASGVVRNFVGGGFVGG